MSKTRYFKSERLHELSVLCKGYQLEGVLLGKKFRKALTGDEKVALWLRRRHFAVKQRNALLAFALLRGKQYHELESTSKQEPDTAAIAKFLEQFASFRDASLCHSSYFPNKMSHEQVVHLWMHTKPLKVAQICKELWAQQEIPKAVEKKSLGFFDKLGALMNWQSSPDNIFDEAKVTYAVPSRIMPMTTVARLACMSRAKGLGPIANIIDEALFADDKDKYADVMSAVRPNDILFDRNKAKL